MTTKRIFLLLLLHPVIFSCKPSGPEPNYPPGVQSDLFYTVGEKIINMYSVKDDIWTNQDDLSNEVRLSFMIDPFFKNKTSNDNLVLYISRFKGAGTFIVGKDFTNIYFVENGMEESLGSNPWWEARQGKIIVTDWSQSGMKGRFEGTLTKKQMDGFTTVDVPGKPIVIENGEFTVRF